MIPGGAPEGRQATGNHIASCSSGGTFCSLLSLLVTHVWDSHDDWT
jgi:hypothetical protein